VAADDEDTTRALCRIFVEMGECYLSTMLSDDDDGRYVRRPECPDVPSSRVGMMCRSCTERVRVRVSGVLWGTNQIRAVDTIAKCTVHPDSDIASMTFKFWSELGDFVW
jgi:hypothetical protein